MTDSSPSSPSAAIKDGKCPSCLGTGRVSRFVPYEDEFPCSTCFGRGLWPPTVCALCWTEFETAEACEQHIAMEEMVDWPLDGEGG